MMMNKQIIKLGDNISIFTDNIKLTNEQIDVCLNMDKLISGKKSVLKLILKGHIYEGVVGMIRLLLNLKRTNEWNVLLSLPLRDILINKGIKANCKGIKIIDKDNNIKFELYNENTKYWWRNWNLLRSYYDSVIVNQYNVSKEKIKNKIVIDVGSNLGEFAIYCVRLGAKKVYAFEPVTETFKILEKQIEINNLKGKIIPVKLALGDKNETLKINFEGAGDATAHINGRLSTNSEIIKVIKLDDFIKKEKVSFIKMDVEGYEEKVLRGAHKVIKRDKPILSFSGYHKKTDKSILPLVVKKIRPDYKIRLLKRGEEDFYCE